MKLLTKLEMGGYGLYVWIAFITTIVILLVFYFFSRNRLKKAIQTNNKLNKKEK